MDEDGIQADGSDRPAAVKDDSTEPPAAPLVEPPRCGLSEAFVNAAGVIQNLDVSGHVSVITCVPGSRRSSHYHKTDEHWLYVVYGYMDYYERAAGSTERPRYTRIAAGEMVYTAPMVEHWTAFGLPTVLVSVSKLHREHETHEADLVRVPWFE